MKKFMLLIALLFPLLGIAQSKSTLSQTLVGTWSFTDEYLEGREMGSVTYTFKVNGTGTKHTSEWVTIDKEIVPAQTFNLKWKLQGNTLKIQIDGGEIEYQHIKKISNNKITGDYYDEFEDYSFVVTFIRK